MLSMSMPSFGSKLDMGSDVNVLITCVVMVAILSCLDLTQLALISIGAVTYAVIQALHPLPEKKQKKMVSEPRSKPSAYAQASAYAANLYNYNNRRKMPYERLHRGQADLKADPLPWRTTVAPPVKPDVYRESSHPVFAPKFESTSWDAEVEELALQLNPTNDEDRALQRLVAHLKRQLETLYPDVEVNGFMHSSILRGTAFGVAVPEVDIVAYVNPAILMRRVRHNDSQKAKQADAQQLSKCATRNACDRLVSGGGLKFRRSAFRGDEPKVTLMVPPELGFFAENIPVDFSINSVTPFYNAALLTECGQIESRAKALMLLVKRWAKDRGICFAAKGHLSPYLWTLLVMYFLQTLKEPLLPMLEAFKISSRLKSKDKRQMTSPSLPASTHSSESDEKLSLGQLFHKFVQFYALQFDWGNEAISVRKGQRAPPDASLPLHVILREDGSTFGVGPAIEDPFTAGINLGTCMNDVTLPRLHEELKRAADICSKPGASLTELLEPWVPLDRTVKGPGSLPDKKL